MVRLQKVQTTGVPSGIAAASLLGSGVEEAGGLLVDVDLHAQQRRAVGLALGVGLERERAPAPERVVEQEVQGAEVGKLEALDAAVADLLEVALDGLGRHPLDEDGVELGAEGDEAHVRRVPLVARPRVRKSRELNFHSSAEC